MAAAADEDDAQDDEQGAQPLGGRDRLVEDYPGADDLHAQHGQANGDGIAHVQRHEAQQSGQGQHGQEAGQIAHDLPGKKATPVGAGRRGFEAGVGDDVAQQISTEESQDEDVIASRLL